MDTERVFANLAVRVPPDLMHELRGLKARTGASLNQIVIDMLREGIETRTGKAEAA